jgi:hypothetical protein
MGIEKDRNINRTTMRTCQNNYGLRLATAFSLVDNDKEDFFVDPITKIPMAVDQMRWLFKKGDVILSNQPREEYQTFVVQFKEHGTKSGEIPIYSYPDEDVPERCMNGMFSDLPELSKGRVLILPDPGMEIVHVLKYNLASIPTDEFESHQEKRKGPINFYASLKINLVMDGNSLKMALYFGKRLLDSGEVNM